MTKFSFTRLGQFLTPGAANARAARQAEYRAKGQPFAAVVHVEADDGSWCELDAEDVDHAKRIADAWVTDMGARGASCRFLRGGHGRLILKSFYMIFADFARCSWPE